MKGTDQDTDEPSLPASDRPSDRQWLGVVGAGVAIVLICAVWTLCA